MRDVFIELCLSPKLEQLVAGAVIGEELFDGGIVGLLKLGMQAVVSGQLVGEEVGMRHGEAAFCGGLESIVGWRGPYKGPPRSGRA